MCIICSPWFRCKSVFHNGMTCQFYQLLQADDNHSLRASVYPNICAPKLKFFHNISQQVWLAEKPEERKLCTGCQVSSLLFISISTVANDASLHNGCCSDSPPLLLYWFLLGTNREGWGMSPCPLCQVRIQFHKKDNFKLPRSPIFSTQINDLSGVERTCVGTAWKSSRQDLKCTTILVVPEELFEYSNCNEWDSTMNRMPLSRQSHFIR